MSSYFVLQILRNLWNSALSKQSRSNWKTIIKKINIYSNIFKVIFTVIHNSMLLIKHSDLFLQTWNEVYIFETFSCFF